MLDRILNKLDPHIIAHNALLFDSVVIQPIKRLEDI